MICGLERLVAASATEASSTFCRHGLGWLRARSRRQESREDAAGGMARDTQIHRVN